MLTRKVLATTTLALALLPTASSYAQSPSGLSEAGDPSSARPGILGKIAIEQKIGQQLPLDLPFADDHGKEVKLGDYFGHGKRPVILALVYYECPMLCSQVLNGLVSTVSTLNFNAGTEYDVVAVSFNPKEGPGLAAQKKANYVQRYGRPQTADGWHFLTGTQDSITRLTDALGFRYGFDKETGQYAHGAAIEVITPKGTIAKYFYGIEYSPRDLRLGLIEASDERIGTVIDDFLLQCYHYDPAKGKYGPAVLNLVRVAGVATILAFAAFLTFSLRREHAMSTSVNSAAGPSSGGHRT